MNSSLVRTMVFAALLSAPLAGFGQIMHTQAGGPRTENLTLLTGPHLTSAPIYSGVGVASLAPKPEEDLAKIDNEIRTMREKLRLLEHEREMALARKKMLEGRLPPLPSGNDWRNYDFKSPAPANLWPQPALKPQPFNGEIRFAGATAKPQ